MPAEKLKERIAIASNLIEILQGRKDGLANLIAD